MAQEQLSRLSAERRCPNCGTRVARDAESCFMCGHDLRIQFRRRQRISWVDALLVLAVLMVLVIWWRLGARSPQETTEAAGNNTILPTNIPLFEAAPTELPTAEPTQPPPPPTPEQTLVTHEVSAGETLLSIALQYGVTVEEIQAANNVQGDLIRPGDKLTIPILSNANTSPAPAGAPGSTRFEYVVRPNDTIISIALAFGSTADAILAANNLAANAIIRPGDRLVIPAGAVPADVVASAPTSEPAAVPTQAPAGPAEVIYIAPRLIGPPDGATLSRGESVLLRWVSVDVLQPNEWYVLLLFPSQSSQPIPSIWTKATSYRLGTELAPEAGSAVTYTWQVSVVRVQTGANGQLVLTPASEPSTARKFTWR